MKRIVFVILFVSIALISTTSASKDLDFNKLQYGVFHIGQLEDISSPADTKWLGTGFLVNKNCTIATAKHLFVNANLDHLIIKFLNPKIEGRSIMRKSKIIYEDPVKDVAFLMPITDNPCRVDPNEFNVFALPSKFNCQRFLGQQVIIIGHPSLWPKSTIDFPIFRRGLISAS